VEPITILAMPVQSQPFPADQVRFHGRQWVGRTAMLSADSALVQPCDARWHGNTIACGPSLSITASSISMSNGAVLMHCHMPVFVALPQTATLIYRRSAG